MVKKYDELKCVEIPNMKGGDGTVIRRLSVESGEYDCSAKVIGKLIFKPGVSIGLHTHEGEEEIMTILAGTGTYLDDGIEYTVHEGDVTVCRNGHTHCIANASEAEDLVVFAVVATI